MDTERYYNWPF